VAHGFSPATDSLNVAQASDLPRFVTSFKQQTGFWFARQYGVRLWQDGYHDRVLRREEETSEVVRYILDNPIRAGLVTVFDRYPYSGSDRYSVSELAEAVSQSKPQG
jgi:hypothetical protein